MLRVGLGVEEKKYFLVTTGCKTSQEFERFCYYCSGGFIFPVFSPAHLHKKTTLKRTEY